MEVERAGEADVQERLPHHKSVLHVTSAHRVSDGRIAHKEASALAAAGYDVTVLGLRRAVSVPLPRGPRFIEYAAPGSRLRRFLFRLPRLLAYCLKHRYDVYHLHDPDLVLLGFVLKLAGRCVIYDVHEAYPMVVLDRDWIPRRLRPLLSRQWRRMEEAFVRRADLTVVAHDAVKRQFRRGRIVTVQNFPLAEGPDLKHAVAMPQRPPRVMYHGDLTEQRGLLTMIHAMAAVTCFEKAELRLGGSLSPAMAARIGRMPGIERTTYLGWLNPERLAEEMALARAGLCSCTPPATIW